MQKELAREQSERPIQILGVNQVGREAGNAAMMAGRTLPWLQETEEADIWTAWGVVYRDVVVVGPDNRAVEVFNLTQKDLGEVENYAELKEHLLSVAAQ